MLSDCDALMVELWEMEGWRMTKEQKSFLRREDMGRDMGRKRTLEKDASFQARKVPAYALVCPFPFRSSY